MTRFWRAWWRRNQFWRSYRVAVLLLRTLFIINRERERVVQARRRGDYSVRPNIEALVGILREFRLTAVALGGLMIKLGQFLGARADLLPGEALAELATLHDEVPPEPFDAIARVLADEWHVAPETICTEIESKPAGAASLGQVHRARLRDGREVALKVQRPGIEAIVHTDLRTLRFVLRIIGWLIPAANQIIDLHLLYREFSRTVAEELDYIQEGQYAEQFAALFAADADIRVPAVIGEYTTRRVLVLEWMEGIKVTDTAALVAAGVDRKRLAQRLIGSYLTQVLDAGFFHADPHPGNIIIQPDPAGDRLVFVDFGMMGTITPRLRGGVRDVFGGFMLHDAARILRGMQLLGFLSAAADLEALEPIIETLLARIAGLGTGTAPPSARGPRGRRDPEDAFSVIGTTLYDQPFRLPAQFAFFGRMAGILLGLTRTLAPDLDVIAVARPYAERFVAGGPGGSGLDAILRMLGVESWEALGRTLLTDGLATAQSLAALPRRLDRVLARAERGELRIFVESEPSGARNRRGGRNGGRSGASSRGGLVGRLLNIPMPLWMPLSLVGTLGAVALTRRRRPRE